ncbi:MAG: hypothetical protein U9N52_08415, partial [Campylobacterota bacterium]|nr:hypothetical protein [Campylobacterota bacterium]
MKKRVQYALYFLKNLYETNKDKIMSLEEINKACTALSKELAKINGTQEGTIISNVYGYAFDRSYYTKHDNYSKGNKPFFVDNVHAWLQDPSQWKSSQLYISLKEKKEFEVFLKDPEAFNLEKEINHSTREDFSIKNIILYGPPGVGKTYNHKKIVALIENQHHTQKEIFESILKNS